jgi:hypothetical protein
MADIIKRVDKGIPVNERYQVFTNADAAATDVILVKSSLYKAASRVTIESGGGMSVRFNVYQTVFPERTTGDGLDMYGGPNISKGQTYKDTSQTPIAIASGGTLEINGDISVSDIEIVSLVGAFTITCL